MMDLTDRHCRYFHRLLSPSALLYSEMLTTGAVLHGDRQRLLAYNQAEHPLALQLGGSDPGELAQCGVIAEQLGYDEINLNVGCPSERVQKGRFGACLMKEPVLVRDCIAAMRAEVSVPVTVKTRLGVDDFDSYEFFRDFIEQVGESGCETYIIHARKAWLSGVSPKQNRDIPPLYYDRVYRLKQEHPEWTIVLNGGVKSVAEVQQHLQQVDGVMLGRAAYQNPELLLDCERRLFGNQPLTSEQVIGQMMDYIGRQRQQGVPLKHISRHLLGLFQGQPGAKRWRRTLSQRAHLPEADESLLQEALAAMNINQAVA